MDGMTWFRSVWDRAVGWALIVTGVGLLAFGAVKVADSVHLADQLAYLMSAGLVGLSAVVLGAGLLVTAALHDEWRGLNGLESAIRQSDERRRAQLDELTDQWKAEGERRRVGAG
ncbi:MAG: hypothetical protein AB1679_30555 [Actinomycetota bacterium]